MEKYRIEKDSLGEVRVPSDKLYGAQTQRAIENFQISELVFPIEFIKTIVLIKKCAAIVNNKLNKLPKNICDEIKCACDQVLDGKYDDQFPLDIFQTGSGTSTNMNVNEVLAKISSDKSSLKINANDHINMSQSSNDVIPTAIHISAVLALRKNLIPSLNHLLEIIEKKSNQIGSIVKTGRTHLMDAMPITFGQELSGWSLQIKNGISRIESSLDRLQKIAQGGTAVGTGINAHVDFAKMFSNEISKQLSINFSANDNFFESLSCQDAIVELSGQLKTISVGLIKIANDLRWMNSGPLAGISDISLEALQPGSSIMPGKVNPVIPEAVIMVCTQVIGNDATITLAGSFGNFQLNVMLPVIAFNILQSINILAGASMSLADKSIANYKVNNEKINNSLKTNPILVTALNSEIGYEAAAKIAKTAYRQKKPILEVALEQTKMSQEKLEKILDPSILTKGGINK